MPRYGPTIHQVHIADGFADDLDELVHQCTKVDHLNYQEFCKIWKRMKIGCLYEGRILSAEVAELTEEVIHIAKHYMLKNTSNFEESVAGLFVVYALLNLQPFPRFAPLRIIPEDVPAIERIDYVARRDKRHDVLYILAWVLIKGPVQYHSADRQYGMDLAIRKYLEGYTSIDRLGVRPKGVFYRQNEELDIIKDIGSMTRTYTKAKMEISETSEFERNLKYIDDDLSNKLESSLKKLISGIHEEQYGYIGPGCDGDSDEEKLYQSRRAIKERAMKDAVKPLKHLVNADDRVASSSCRQHSHKKHRKKQVKVKVTNCPPMSRSERKRRIPISPRAMKKYRNNTDADMFPRSSTDSEDTTDSSQDSDDKPKKVKRKKISPAVDKLKPKRPARAARTVVEEETEEAEDGDAQELDIQIDTLPVFIRTEDQGKVYEIEIIDEVKKTNELMKPMRTYTKKNALDKINAMPGLTLKKIAPVKDINAPSTSGLHDQAQVIVNTAGENNAVRGPGRFAYPGIQHVEKRDMKRVHMKSKFKRLGMLPVANFEPGEKLSPEYSESEESES